ncbi:MAG: hypothetical protein ACYDBV_08005 [Nitrospiria bacterium]
MKIFKNVNRIPVSIFALFMIIGWGMGYEAKALTVNSGDLILALYGNGTEYYQNLGNVSSLLAQGASTSFNLSATTLATVGGLNPVKWSLAGYSADPLGNPTFINTSLNPISASQLSQVTVSNGWLAFSKWALLNYDNQTSETLSSSSFLSYSHYMDSVGNGSFAGTFPVSTTGGFGSTLNIIAGNYSNNAISSVRTVSLSLLTQTGSAILTISGSTSPVPLPPSAAMFGTGLIVLAGIVQRRLNDNDQLS